MTEIIFTTQAHLGVITLNRPTALNALSLNMILALQEQLRRWETDSSIYAIIIKAAPGKAFCAGGDVRWLYDMGLVKNCHLQREFFTSEYRLNHYLHDYKKPYVALMDGITMGGGVGISLHGSHPIATEKFVFAMPETSIGFFPDIGASYLLSRCPDYMGIYLALSGAQLSAAEAYSLGLVKQIVAANNLDMLLANLEASNWQGNPFDVVTAECQQLALPAGDSILLQKREIIRNCFSRNSVEEIFWFLQQTEEEWAQATFNNLQKKSPLSLKITLAQMQKAKTLSMADCIAMDLCLVEHFMINHDFYEGVRALLIDKDKMPYWQPNTLADVTHEQVESYFRS